MKIYKYLILFSILTCSLSFFKPAQAMQLSSGELVKKVMTNRKFLSSVGRLASSAGLIKQAINLIKDKKFFRSSNVTTEEMTKIFAMAFIAILIQGVVADSETIVDCQSLDNPIKDIYLCHLINIFNQVTHTGWLTSLSAHLFNGLYHQLKGIYGKPLNKNEITDDTKCPVCMEKSDDFEVICNNNHFFCVQCIQKMYETSQNLNCPLCRQQLTVGITKSPYQLLNHISYTSNDTGRGITLFFGLCAIGVMTIYLTMKNISSECDAISSLNSEVNSDFMRLIAYVLCSFAF